MVPRIWLVRCLSQGSAFHLAHIGAVPGSGICISISPTQAYPFCPGDVAVIMGRVTISVVFMPRFGLVFWASEIAALITRPIRIRGMQNIASSSVLRIGP